MIKKTIPFLLIFFIIFIIYFGVGTHFTFKPKWSLDYFNPLAQSLIKFRLDIPNPQTTYDLAYFNGKWFAPWGPLPSFFLIPIQLILGRFVPTFYFTVSFASLNAVVVYAILMRLKKEFFPNISQLSLYLVLILFAFGTVQFYVGTLGSVWHVDQMVSTFFATLGIYFIFRKKRTTFNYIASSVLFGLTLLGRPTFIFLLSMPIFLYFWDNLKNNNYFLKEKADVIKKGIIIFALPLVFFSSLFFLYNYLRFNNIAEYGYHYLNEGTYLSSIRQRNGVISLNNVGKNLWYMLFEIPSLSKDGKVKLNFNLNGNSIFFLTPPLLAAFLASPLVRKKNKLELNPYIFCLWLGVVITILPSLMHYSSGWMQFGYRFSLDITLPLILLSIFGMKGKLNVLYVLGICFAVFMYILGINALM